jgi:hypothetical protein
MERKSGKLIIDDNGKLILTGEVFDEHGSYDFNAYVDTGCSFGMVLTRELADAVCAKVEGEIDISIGGGSNTVTGQKRRVNLRFGELVLNNYKITVVDGTRNLVGIEFFQDTGTIMLVEFHKGKTMGGLITNDRRFASALGKTAHCFLVHKNDITKSNEPCPICGTKGE